MRKGKKVGRMSDLHLEMQARSTLKISDKFDGATFEHKFDAARLKGQLKRVHSLMTDGQWRTLAEIESHTGDPAASISARLRDLRKERFGAFKMERRARGARANGLNEYRVVPGDG